MENYDNDYFKPAKGIILGIALGTIAWIIIAVLILINK
jgi:hypothetical protein